MAVTQYLKGISGAVSGAAERILKQRLFLLFDPDDFDVEDVPDVRLNGTQSDPAIATGYSRIRVRAGTALATVFGAPTAIAIGDATTEGVSTEYVRRDHKHGLAAPGAPASVGAANSAGVSTKVAREDHVHQGVAEVGFGLALDGASASVRAHSDGSILATTNGTQVGVLANDTQHGDLGGGNLHEVVGVSAGFMSSADKTKLDALSWNAPMGANTLTGTTTTRYLSPGFNTGTASANILDMAVTKAFKIDSMRYVARIGGTAGQTITATVRKNGAAVGTAVLTVASDATSGSSAFTAVSLAAGDTWGLQIDKSGSIASSPTDAMWTLGLTPP